MKLSHGFFMGFESKDNAHMNNESSFSEMKTKLECIYN